MGENSFNYDNKVYTFINNITNEIYKGTQYFFRKRYNLDSGLVCNLIKGKRKSHKNWQLFFN